MSHFPNKIQNGRQSPSCKNSKWPAIIQNGLFVQSYAKIQSNLIKHPIIAQLFSNFSTSIRVASATGNQNGYECNTFLNSGLSYDELGKVILKLKNNIAIGCDGIPNEVLCNSDVTMTLFRIVFNCF